jgi:hypothetical protein
MLLCRTVPLPCKSGKTAGCNLFAPLLSRLALASAKSCEALPAHKATIVLPDFTRSRSAEKKIEKKSIQIQQVNEIKIGKGLKSFLHYRQQISFGKNQEKQMAKSAGKGHSKFLHAGYKNDWVARQKDCSPRFFLVVRKGLKRKEASLLTRFWLLLPRQK